VPVGRVATVDFCKSLSRSREREGPAADGGGKVRVFFLLLSRHTLGRRQKTLPDPSRKREGKRINQD